MTIKELENSLVTHAGGHLVTIAEISAWSGRSREYIRSIIRDVEYCGGGSHKYFFTRDVAKAFYGKEYMPE